MKYFALCALALVAFASAGPAKRFAGFGGVLSSVGGNLGCVVTGNKLYINGLFEKNLTSGEQEEFSDYQQRLTTFKTEIRQAIAQRRQELLEQRRKNGENGEMITVDQSNDESSASSSASNSSLPKPPEKPSFCQGDLTTQYIFDGCKVQVSYFHFWSWIFANRIFFQNNKVYVGQEYARDLTTDEIQKLQDFDKKMTAYQAQLSSSLQQQVKEIFGDQLAALFGNGRVNSTLSASTPAPIESDATTTAAPIEAPDAPNFCTIVF